MFSNERLAFILFSSLGLAACGGGQATGGSSGTDTAGGTTGTGSAGSAAGGVSGLPCDVDAVLAKNCQSCHGATPTFGAPMPLVTYDDLLAPGLSDSSRKVYQLVGERVHDDKRPMPQPPYPALTDAEMQTLDAWIAAGAKSSTDKCDSPGSSGSGGGVTPPSCTPDILLKPTKAFTMPKDAEDVYVCYGIDLKADQKRHVTTFMPRVDNSKIVHHILLFQSDKPTSTEPYLCGAGGPSGARIVSVWAPGGQAFELPKEAGIPLEGATHYEVQVHYNNLQHLEGETDASGFDLCSTTELRPNDADILAFGTLNIKVPASGSQDVTCDFDIPAGTQTSYVIGGMPHMHKLGTTISTVVKPGLTGTPVDLGTREPWNFNSQYWDVLDKVPVKAGDRVSTRCAWKNPGAKDVGFGEDTGSEMCFSFAMYYPKITDKNWNWIIPSLASKCAPTP